MSGQESKTMKRDEFDRMLFEEVPELRGMLHFERADYHASTNRALIAFTADTLVENALFLRIKKVIGRAFPQLAFSLRVSSPGLAEDFLSDPGKYAQTIMGILQRAHPGIRSWADGTLWSGDGTSLSLGLPDGFALEYAQKQRLADRLAVIVYDLFRTRPPISLYIDSTAAKKADAAEEGPSPIAERVQGTGAPPARPSRTSDTKKNRPRRIKGSLVTGQPKAIAELNELSGRVVVSGKVVSAERRNIPGRGMIFVSFVLTDFTGSITCKVFLRPGGRRRAEDVEGREPLRQELRQLEEMAGRIRQGDGLKVRGDCQMDSYDKALVLMALDITAFDWPVREDKADEKRIELHAHTKMSAMDGVVSAQDLVERAARWGHKAIAITDTSVVQAFPEAFTAAKKAKIRLIPGLEAHMIDSLDIVRHADSRLLSEPMVVLDFETTGLKTSTDRIIEIGAVRLENGSIVDSFSMLVNPGIPLSATIRRLTKLSDSDLVHQPGAAEALPKLLHFIGDSAVAAHNADFDCAILKSELSRLGLSFDAPQIDTLSFAQKLYPDLKRYKLSAVCKHLGVSLKNAHRAVTDATATAQCLSIMLEAVISRGAQRLDDVDRYAPGYVKTSARHVSILAASQQGMVNINRLVSLSYLKHFHRTPRIPREAIAAHREGLLIGSACGEGEIFQALLHGASAKELKEIAGFYDYLEIQPVDCHVKYVHLGLADPEMLENINRSIVELGREAGLPVIATGNVHCLDPEDSMFRAVLRYSQRDEDYLRLPSLHFMTTDEMLDAFSTAFGAEKARELVVKNPRLLLDRMEEVSLYPRHPEGKTTFSPHWDGAAEEVEQLSYRNARKLYGDPLPEPVEKRLKKELAAIIGYQFATLYSIAHKLVTKSEADGYPVGSRGSVGSSLVATLCEITEVNPLPPHYRCQACRGSVFETPEGYAVGADLPDRTCPACGTLMIKDGYYIPFEVFLGFKGDKVPDIDLNFPGVYQPRAHAYAEELFGKGFVFRAGTIMILKEKTALALVQKFAGNSAEELPEAEVKRLAAGCVGVKRTTGQHPGGLVVLPKEYEINQFTAVQHPADGGDTSVVTTHYDFSSMHDILVKLDILGHDDPTMIHMLGQLTGVDYRSIPLNDPKVMSLFLRPEALGLKAELIECQTGTLAVPEFGTPFVRQILSDTKPTTIEELIRIAGLSHGTDVWLGNAKHLIESDTATLRDCICTRDDIMNYLISVGVDAKVAFDVMENVRKGGKLTPAMETAMKKEGVPDWYIESCNKIGYMFPKAHAVAYVIMALRVAWFKVHHPLAFYAAYFTIRGTAFDARSMVRPEPYIRSRIHELSEMGDKGLSGKDKDELVVLEVVLEMLQRGYTFLPPDLYASDAREFRVEKHSLRAPLASLNGFGDTAALGIVKARTEPFVSVEDLKNRTRISAACIEMLREAGALDSLSQSSQIDFFSLI